MFNTTEPTPSWETWHRRFGHLGKSSIKLLHNNMVKGLHISLNSPQYDCVACVQVKQHVTLLSPFPKASVETQTQTKQSELTHTDLWDKYCKGTVGAEAGDLSEPPVRQKSHRLTTTDRKSKILILNNKLNRKGLT